MYLNDQNVFEIGKHGQFFHSVIKRILKRYCNELQRNCQTFPMYTVEIAIIKT